MMTSRWLVPLVFLTACSAAPPPGPTPAPPPPKAPPAAPPPAAAPSPAPPAKVDPVSVREVALPAPPADLAGPHVAAAKGDWNLVVEQLDALKRDIQRAPVDVKVHAAILRARAHLAAEEIPQASTAYRKAVNSFNGADKDLKNALAAIDKAGEYDARLAAMNRNFGEALFFLGEDKREKLDAITVEPYDGPPDEAKVRRYFEKDVDLFSKRWVQAMDKALKDYARVESIEPAPQVWVVGMAARKARMLERHHDALVALQAPAGWAPAAPAPAAAAASAASASTSASAAPAASAAAPAPEAAAREAFEEEKKKAVEAALAQTKEAFEACVDAAGSDDSRFARYCMAWLGKPLPKAPAPEPAMPAPRASAAPAASASAAPPQP